jgi:hypothetical protein
MALERRRVAYQGETLELPLPDGPGKALKLTITPAQPRLPIYLAAMGHRTWPWPGSWPTAGSGSCSRPSTPAGSATHLTAGAARAGRDLDGFDVAPNVQVHISDDLGRGPRRHAPVPGPVHRRHGLRGAQLLHRAGRRYGFEEAAGRSRSTTWPADRAEAMAPSPTS